MRSWLSFSFSEAWIGARWDARRRRLHLQPIPFAAVVYEFDHEFTREDRSQVFMHTLLWMFMAVSVVVVAF